MKDQNKSSEMLSVSRKEVKYLLSLPDRLFFAGSSGPASDSRCLWRL